MVVYTDAIVNPLTMMIIPLYTFIADRTMDCSRWFKNLTNRTYESLVEVFIQFQERYLF